jgi:hypothetical protein
METIIAEKSGSPARSVGHFGVPRPGSGGQ